MFYVTTVPVSETVYCRTVGWFLNGNWEVSGRKWSWRHRGLSRHLPGGTAENYEQPVRMADDPADILTSHLSYISLKLYCWTVSMYAGVRSRALTSESVCNKFLFNKTNRRTDFPNLFLWRNSTCFGQFLCPSSGVFHCTSGTGICHAGLMTAFKHWPCLKAVIKPAWHIPVPNVQWKTPDDGQRNCPKHAEFLDKNKFGKLVRLLVLLKRNLLRCTVIWT